MRKPDPAEELMALRALLRRLCASDPDMDGPGESPEAKPGLAPRPGWPIRRLVPRALH